jgi:two-component sensor histidine kinase/DNA-binding response OmpR family regulator
MNGKPANILLVEDEEHYAYVVSRYFESRNGEFSITVAESIKAARDRLKESRPDLIITDLKLPDGNGTELLYDNSIKNEIPIVVVTGWGDEQAAVHAMKQGALDYIVKSQDTIKEMPHIAERALREWNHINQRRLAEEALQNANEDLEKRIHERTAELQSVNEVLKSEIIKRKRIEKKIKASLDEKELLLKEIHHRVKNNLQFICSLLSLKSQQFEDEQIRGIFNECRDRVRSMALIHEKMMSSRDFGNVDFPEYIKDLTNSLYRSFKIDPEDIILNVNVEDMALGIDLAIPFGLIINELVSNSLKYAFPPSRKIKGRIDITLRTNSDGEIELNFWDNGVGIPKDLDIKTTKTLGLRLVTILIEDQLMGKCELDRRKGTKFRIRFKKPE